MLFVQVDSEKPYAGSSEQHWMDEALFAMFGIVVGLRSFKLATGHVNQETAQISLAGSNLC